MRRKKAAAPENHERWVVSYADFITLLFAFFVVMFASSQSDRSRAKAISQAIDRALQNGAKATALATPGKPASKDGKTAQDLAAEKAVNPMLQLLPSLNALNAALRNEIKNGTVQLKLESRGLIIGLNTTAFFPSGDDTVDPSAYPVITKVAAVLNGLPNSLRLEGHTDSLPIKTERFRSNWELSAARSIAMLRVLNERYGVNLNRMAIVGYADTLSVDSNDTEQGRGRNRRVDIVIVSEFGMHSEPQPVKRTAGAASAPSNPGSSGPSAEPVHE